VTGGLLVPGETSRPDAPVVHLRPDAPGTYVLTLDAPDGTHRQRVRAYPDERQSVELRVPAADLPVDDGDVDRVSVMWPHNDRLLARDRPATATIGSTRSRFRRVATGSASSPTTTPATSTATR